MSRQKFGGSEPLDLETIRQSPRQFVDLETVEKLSDYAMVCELKIERLTAELAEAKHQIAYWEERNKPTLKAQNEPVNALTIAESMGNYNPNTKRCVFSKSELRLFAEKLAQQPAQDKDAERYRWLKNNDTTLGIYDESFNDNELYYVHDADAAIDAAIAKQKGT